MDSYTPQPIDTSKVQLDASLLELTEFLARNTHEVWAQGRLDQGWTLGVTRDDSSRKHPDLIPYEALKETEKDFDRRTAMETLKVILALGYRIESPKPGVGPGLPGPGEQVMVDASQFSLSSVIRYWQLLDKGDRYGWIEDYRALGGRALKLGEPLLAYDILRHGLQRWPKDVKLRQLQARAHAVSGALRSAMDLLRSLRRDGNEDVETIGLLGRVYKDRWERTLDPQRKHKLLGISCGIYEKSYRADRQYWTGINAATLACCLGRKQAAAEIAEAVWHQCLAEVARTESQGKPAGYWELATLGEAALVLGDEKSAQEYYWRAAGAPGRGLGELGSTRRNARLLLRAAAGDSATAPEIEEKLETLLPMPRVVVFSGHMHDLPERPVPRFPRDLEPMVAAEIRSKLKQLNCGIGYASGAAGSDILFLEAVREMGGEINIVLPYEPAQFHPDSVNRNHDPDGARWQQRLEALIAADGTRLITASQGRVEVEGLAMEFANQFTFGLAGIRAWQLGAQLAPLAVWNGQPGDGAGGTADAVARWRARGLRPIVIELDKLLETHHPELAGRVAASAAAYRPSPVRTPASGAMSGKPMALLFADVSGFSKLSEREIPLFAEHFLQPVAALIGQSEHRPIQKNTWGDGLYFVFKDVNDAGLFALELRDLVMNTNWKSLGFERELSLRTGLHVGPVYKCMNPVTERWDYIGTHVSRAARIEPVTPKGQVYASEVFAAIAFAEGASGFQCDYVGQVGLAKDFGTFPTYHVRRSARRNKSQRRPAGR